ncbi:FAD-binding protein [Alkalicella caledoniensis]|uniref:FAD-binding protein n=1 Tax=Alkalicella caledoniensis TaxID=2731377 RepID=A0A7G9W570_ALKCA|nr:FAD-linked oxidase C-terminal domain-containing protein [Alkalicella caledoniensis]QNO13832.1 FAD-binding protein [Alkalicella caledoniensis]
MAYQKVTQKDIDFLISITAADRVYSGDQINDDFTHDEMQEYGKFMPEVVIEAISTEEVSQIMKHAHANNIPVTPRGSGTGLCGGAVAIHGGIMLSLTKMNKIIEIDEENLMGTVQAGVLLMEFIKAVTEKGLFYPPDPGEKSATIGGNVMTNAGGMRAVKYGVTRDYVRGMKIVLANGEILETGGKVIKNSSGYSIKDMMVGSEGTLGIATEITVRLLPLPKKAVSLLVPFGTLDQCIETVPHILRSRSTPTAVEFMQRETIENAEEHLGKQFPDKSSDAYLLLSFDGNSTEEIEGIYDEVAQLCLSKGALDVFISNTQERHESIWSTRGAFLEAIKGSTPEGLDECDVVVPKNRVADFVKFCAELNKEYGVRIRQFGHAGDGNLHVYCCKDQLSDDEWKPKVEAIMQRMYDKAIELEGQVSGEHGIGHAKVGFLGESVGAPVMNILEGVKKAFDPKNILNPGKVVNRF